MSELFDNALLFWCGTGGLEAIERECSEHLSGGREYWRGPARSQSFSQGQMAVIVPQRVRLDVGNDHRFFPVNGCSTRTGARTDQAAVNGFGVTLWKVRRCAVPKTLAIGAHQENRNQSAVRQLLAKLAHRTQDLRERTAPRYQFKNSFFSGEQCLRLLQFSQAKATHFEFALTLLQLESKQFDRLGIGCRFFQVGLHAGHSRTLNHNINTYCILN